MVVRSLRVAVSFLPSQQSPEAQLSLHQNWPLGDSPHQHHSWSTSVHLALVILAPSSWLFSAAPSHDVYVCL